MNVLTLILSAVITAQPLANPEVLEPSVLNEVEHALSRAPKFSRVALDASGRASLIAISEQGKTATEKAVALVSSQKSDGRWLDGTNDVTFAAVAELKRLAYGDGAFKVLMIGNSFSISNCRHMPAICEAMGIPLELGSLYIGGCSLERHWQNVAVASTNATYAPYTYDHYRLGRKLKDAPKSANIPAALRARRWDVVTVQQCSSLSWKGESYHPFGDDLVRTIRELAPQAEIVVQETWSYTPWDRRFAKWGFGQNEMYEKLHDAYAAFAKPYGFRVIPTGTAVQEWRRRLPVKYAENGFGGDVVGNAKEFVKGADGRFAPKGDVCHFNRRGEYLQSLVWTAKLFGVDVTRCACRPDFLSESDAALMKAIASELGAKAE